MTRQTPLKSAPLISAPQISRPLMLLMAALIALACLVWPGKAHAGVSCSFTSQSISFGTANTATGTVGYSCTNYDATTYAFTICSALGTPSFPGTSGQPIMLNGGNQLNFNVYTNASFSTVWRGTTYLTNAVTLNPFTTISGSMSFYGQIPTGQGAAAGSYAASFFSTTLGGIAGSTCVQNGTFGNGASFAGTNNTLSVAATVPVNCTVSASSPLSLGTAAANATNLWGSTSISVNCPSGTPYYIGLAPSNGSTTGAGVLSGTGGNTDKPPYQLRSVSNAGPVWGNTATATSAGNGVAGTGNAATQTITAYATLPSANYKPDSYSDTVTVNLNF